MEHPKQTKRGTLEYPRESPELQGIWRRLHPAVPRHWLFLFAGMIWIAVGVLLCYRTVAWISPLPFGTELLLEGIGVLLAAVGYLYAFAGIVRKNIDRIQALPDRACAFAFTAWRGYLMIGLMITIGMALRNSSLPKEYLVIPYTAMGGMLLIGSQRFVRQFVAAVSRKPS